MFNVWHFSQWNTHSPTFAWKDQLQPWNLHYSEITAFSGSPDIFLTRERGFKLDCVFKSKSTTGRRPQGGAGKSCCVCKQRADCNYQFLCWKNKSILWWDGHKRVDCQKATWTDSPPLSSLWSPIVSHRALLQNILNRLRALIHWQWANELMKWLLSAMPHGSGL